MADTQPATAGPTEAEKNAAWQAGYDGKGKTAKDNPYAADTTPKGRALTICWAQGDVAGRTDRGEQGTPDGASWSIEYLPSDTGGAPRVVETLEQLLLALNVDREDGDAQRMAVAALMCDDVWDLAPLPLKAQVGKWIKTKPVGATS